MSGPNIPWFEKWWTLVIGLIAVLAMVWSMAGCWSSIMQAAALAAPKCSVDPSPRVTQAPLRFLQSKVTIEPDDHLTVARLALVGLGGVARTSVIDTDVRTQWIRWQLEPMPAGEYVVVLDVWNDVPTIVCHAEARVIVGSSDN